MYDKLYSYLNKIHSFTTQDEANLEPFLKTVQLPKKGFLIRSGELCSSHWFVVEGTLIKYIEGQDDQKHIVQFAIEDWWLGDLESVNFNKKSDICIQALEDSILIEIKHEDYDKISDKIEFFPLITREIIIKSAIANRKRIQNLLSLSSEERYSLFVRKYPEISIRVPLHMIASYLGIKAETLSRLRRRPRHDS